MKKLVLPCLGLMAILPSMAQHRFSPVKNNGYVHANIYSATKEVVDEGKSTSTEKITNPNEEETESAEKNAQPPTSIVWKRLTGSMNCYGQIVSNTKPLQYNPQLNAVSYIHRKSSYYNPTPGVPSGSESGVIVAEISSDWGATWDSTCIWAGSANAGRYPQGGIYNPSGNTNIANAYVVGSGPTVNGSAFTGNFYASKKLAAPGSTLYNTTADASPNAQQFLSFTLPSYPTNQTKHGWSRYGFSSTDDGVVRSLALVQNDQTTLGNAAKMRGVAIVKGTFGAGTFNWTTDTLIPSTFVTTQGDKVLSSDVQMAFSQNGAIGYVVMLGAKNTASLSNKGYQPIIFKTNNSGASWTEISGINFNASGMNEVTSHLAGVKSGNDTIALPYFTNYDLAVDSAGYLHIGALVCSGAIAHTDSLNYIAQYTMSTNPSAKYLWGHRAGLRPYLYDFIGDGTDAWKVITVDSLSSEDPGAATSSSGYSENPWDATGTNNAKVNMDARIQLGRTPNGNYITYSWAESDTNFTNGSHKWNVIPNIKSRCLSARGTTSNYRVSSNEINVSKPAPGTGSVNPNINSRATLHYMSPTSSQATVLATPLTSTVDLKMPFTVTNSNPFSQLTSNSTWYTAAHLSFAFSNLTIGLSEITKDEMETAVFPNPASENVMISIKMEKSEMLQVSLYNTIGGLVKEKTSSAVEGSNEIPLDLTGLNKGLYILNIKVGNSSTSKKLIVQ